jgi:hypothetical protein
VGLAFLYGEVMNKNRLEFCKSDAAMVTEYHDEF